jgi:hypothetical protein
LHQQPKIDEGKELKEDLQNKNPGFYPKDWDVNDNGDGSATLTPNEGSPLSPETKIDVKYVVDLNEAIKKRKLGLLPTEPGQQTSISFVWNLLTAN